MEEEKAYIGTKIIRAIPMDEKTWNESQGRPEDVYRKAGMKVPDNRPGYKVRYEDGYLSWSPKKTFERAYRLVTPEEANLIKG